VATNGTIVPALDDRWEYNIRGIIGRRKARNSGREREREKTSPLLIYPPQMPRGLPQRRSIRRPQTKCCPQHSVMLPMEIFKMWKLLLTLFLAKGIFIGLLTGHITLRRHLPLTFQNLAISLLITKIKIRKFYMVLALRWVFCTDFRTDSGLCFIRYQLIGFYNRGWKCLQRSTGWFLIYSRLRFFFKRLMGLTSRPLCRRCAAEDETLVHTLCECEALASLRYVRIFGFLFLGFGGR
jgi:hypothetical protein